MNSPNEGTPLIRVAQNDEGSSLSRIFRWTPVELLVVLHTVTIVALGTVQTFYVIDETAKKHGQKHIVRHAENSCYPGNITNTSHINDTSSIIQKESAEIIMYLGFCSTFASVIPIFLLGYLSDFFGRRVMYITSICGTVFKELILLLTVLLRLPIWVLYIGQIGFAFTGTFSGSMVQIFATVSDITPPGKKRAFRITVVQATGMLTAAVTNYCMGYWILTERFREPITMSLAISMLTIFLSIFILRKPTEHDSQPKSLLGPLKLYIRDTPQHRRRKLLLCLLVFLLSSSCLQGKLEYQTLFLMHQPICWNAFNIQVMHAIQTLVNTVCVVGIVRLFLKFTEDVMVLLIASISGIASMLILGFSVTSWMVYLHVIFGFVSISVFPVMRAMMSRVVDPQEQGFLFASIAGLDELQAALTGVVYGKMYTASVDWFPGFIFLIMAAVFSVAFAGSIILYKWLKGNRPDRI
ncbi:proton-coupled folate transporter-like [Mytilus edulis]|uniref:proton-coupled folate transporter-like n=1 Tax=Mytilus edulis TaxID=6550 RepID=UPI0039EE215E